MLCVNIHVVLSLSPARLIRVCLGQDSVEEEKCGEGNPLVILGIQTEITQMGVTLQPSDDKVLKWTRWIEDILRRGRMPGGEASKLAGALQWAAQHSFKRLGRAMIRPIVAQEQKRTSAVDEQLRLALRWWLEVLQGGIKQMRPWVCREERPVHMFCDARSTPPRVAAVLVRCVRRFGATYVSVYGDKLRAARDGRTTYCDMEPPSKLMDSFMVRGDNQIMSLEILSIALGKHVL